MRKHTARYPLIGIAGKAGSGKDHLGEALSCFLLDWNNVDVFCLSFATPLKLMLASLLRVDPARFESLEFKESMHPQYGVTYREMLQTLGTEWGRKLVHPDIWVLAAAQEWERERGGIFTDVRFENEAQWIHSEGGIILETVLLDKETQTAHVTHESEAGLPQHLIDMRVEAAYGDLDGLYARGIEACKEAGL